MQNDRGNFLAGTILCYFVGDITECNKMCTLRSLTAMDLKMNNQDIY